ncbi:6-phosphofructokinase [Fimbriimonas ginsengisoli Gsoil 348]|uniref:6-phosphofructokinase n=1 Tax=Fimbriimonas ginsengisoli Gsoil 348 TaxID=661478 RepID=A0A068NT42_FIMGI|nr:6-phosphofructokinase [Fimbriimonas ginsengisoli Gsoil 348]
MTSGGDCAGLNAVIAAIVRAGYPLGYEFIGFERGWEGLLSPPCYRELKLQDIRGISHLGGTILKTTNKGRFGAKDVDGVKRIPMEVLEDAKRNADALGLSGLIVIGGDGSLSGALQLCELGLPIVGVPKTIDNDLSGTDRTFGFSTAVQVVVDSLDRIHSTATSHDRVMFVETMGRHAGWIALRAGVAGGAHAILLPEFPFMVEDLVDFLRLRRKHTGSTVVMVAEGAKLHDNYVGRANLSGEVHLGGVTTQLMDEIEALSPGEFEMRVTVLGHIQRGGTPNAPDRTLAKAYGVHAIHAFDKGHYGHMVRYNCGQMDIVPISEACGSMKIVTTDALDYQTAIELGVFIHRPTTVVVADED